MYSSGAVTSRTTLHFQHTFEDSNTLSRAQTIVAALEELETKTLNGVESDVPHVFSRLVATLRTTSYPTLAKVFSHTRNQHTRSDLKYVLLNYLRCIPMLLLTFAEMKLSYVVDTMHIVYGAKSLFILLVQIILCT